MKQSKQGGGNLFADGFQVAEALRKEQPAVFQTLAKTPIEYLDWGEEKGQRHQVSACWPILNLNSVGRVEAVIYNNQVRSWFLEAPPEMHYQVYDAMKTFDDYCYQERHLLRIKLNGGELVMFANNRVLHGREATGRDRHYEGAYFSFDAIKSKIRVIQEADGSLEHTNY